MNGEWRPRTSVSERVHDVVSQFFDAEEAGMGWSPERLERALAHQLEGEVEHRVREAVRTLRGQLNRVLMMWVSQQ